jgi:16S rRNA (cytidine1402-2'-O)-methyltransferase
MSALFESALATAQTAAGPQHYPTGTLYVVATPIGNLADISLRALHVLNLCDTVACEDTRHSQSLLHAYHIDKTNAQWLALHQHNETEVAQEVVRRLQTGQRVAYMSDAGTPAISDPGARLVWQVQQAGLRVMPLPGASSVTALLSACGTPYPDTTGFVFVGFLPSKTNERNQAVQNIRSESRTQVLLEAPHRIEPLALALSVLGERYITIGRELTKQFEEVCTLAAQDMPAWLQAHAQRTRGEFVLVVHAHATSQQPAVDTERLLRLLLQELPLKTSVKLAAELTGQARNAIYAQALVIKETGADGDHGSE